MTPSGIEPATLKVVANSYVKNVSNYH